MSSPQKITNIIKSIDKFIQRSKKNVINLKIYQLIIFPRKKSNIKI